MTETETGIAETETRRLQVAIAEVRRLCQMTIRGSVRVQAVAQARDTLAILDAVTSKAALPGDAAWHSVWLHGNWRYLTKQMPTPEREYAADAVARCYAALGAADGENRSEDPTGLRWWREGA